MKRPSVFDGESSTVKYRATIQYIGTRYAGWQVQANQITVQGTIQKTLERLAGRPVNVIGAGRTDSGVHARGQVAHFFFPDKDSITDLRHAINSLLPWDIKVMRLKLAPPSFHARKSALKKRYQYEILNRRSVPPFLHNQVSRVTPRLDVEAMQSATRFLVGRYDFTSFAAASTTVRNKVRTVSLSDVRVKGRRITYRIEADGFLHHMVRNIAGTLIEVGHGKRQPQEMARVLESRDRSLAGPTAPSEGLYLVKIWY